MSRSDYLKKARTLVDDRLESGYYLTKRLNKITPPGYISTGMTTGVQFESLVQDLVYHDWTLGKRSEYGERTKHLSAYSQARRIRKILMGLGTHWPRALRLPDIRLAQLRRSYHLNTTRLEVLQYEPPHEVGTVLSELRSSGNSSGNNAREDRSNPSANGRQKRLDQYLPEKAAKIIV